VPSIRNLDRLSLAQPVTFFFGDNASGKTTLLEAIARLSGLNLEGGSRRHDFSTTGRTSQLAEAIRLHGGGITMSRGNAFFYRADQFAHFVHTAPEIKNVKKQVRADLQVLSRGESFHKLVDICFDESGLYLLDEPEVALPPLQQLAFLRIMHELVEQGSQFVIVSHSPILLAYPGAVLYELSETGIHQRDYESTDHYRTMHAFMLNREKVLNDLLAES
jgi:predicted ATPase